MFSLYIAQYFLFAGSLVTSNITARDTHRTKRATAKTALNTVNSNED